MFKLLEFIKFRVVAHNDQYPNKLLRVLEHLGTLNKSRRLWLVELFYIGSDAPKLL